METLPSLHRGWPTGMAVLISAGVHLAVVGVAVRGPGVTRYLDDSRILPALYLYARDRQPSEVRESRLPIPAPPGHADGVGRTVVALGFDEGLGLEPPHVRGLTPPGPEAADFDSVFSVLAVDSEVVRVEGSSAPAYPATMLANGMEGLVEAEFVVDTTGWVDGSSVRILQSSHQEFAASVRLALMGMQFRPAWRGARRVRQLVTQRFSFRMEHPQPGTTL